MPNLKSTSDYTVSNIPYTPYPYATANGNTDSTFYRTGSFSKVINFSFPFCFYDSVFSGFVESPSGLISFETGISGCFNNFGQPLPIPFPNGAGCGSVWYYPRSTIFGCYADLDPGRDSSINYFASPPERKIEWREEGLAPCRRLVVSYYHVGSFFSPDCSFTNPTTFQMVMYESSGLIEVYIENYTCINNFDAGLAILGIQNWARDKGIAAPGKNATVWTAHHEAYRFTPSAGASRFVSCKLYTLGGSFVADADTATNAADSSLLNIQFNNICPLADTTQYLVQTSYTACITADIITGMDTITIIKEHPDPVISNTGTGTLQTGSFSSYQWLLNAAAIPNANAQTYQPVQSGAYQVIVTGTEGCSDTSAPYYYTVAPITLLSFSAYYNNKNANIVNWQTSQEISTSRFNVQRSYTLPDFTTIATLPAAGNSNAVRSYSYTDNGILLQPAYYRLEQVDIDGKTSYTKTVMVNPAKRIFAISSLYPNPAQNNLTVEFSSITISPLALTVTDILGRRMLQKILSPHYGFNKIQVNTASLAKGNYTLRLAGENGILQKLFIK